MTGRLVLGCMGFGGAAGLAAGLPAGLAAAEAAVDAALEAGITHFDHADIYGRGSAEAVFGELLSRAPDLRARITIQTKCGIRLPDGDRPGLYDLRASAIRDRVHASLERLRVDYLDCLLLHRPDPLTGPAEVARALTDLHDEGVVLSVGVSNMSAAQIAAIQEHTDLPLTVNQLEMSLHRRDWLEGEVLVNTPASATVGFPHGTVEFCRRSGVRLQAWAPLAQGRFTGAPRQPDDEIVAALVTQLADLHATTPETIVLWWLQQHPAHIVPVIGTTRPERIRACRDAATGSSRLTHEQWYQLWVTSRQEPLP
jgi:predicted oxidoreductase